MKAETTRIPYDLSGKVIESHHLMDRVAHQLLIYGMDLAVRQGLNLDQLLSPDKQVITDVEILIGVQAPALQIIAPFLMEANHIARAMQLANCIKNKQIGFYANEPGEKYGAEDKVQNSLEIIEECIEYLTREHARLYTLALDFTGTDPINLEILSSNPDSFINTQFVGNLDINANLTIAFANAAYRTIRELKALMQTHPDYPFTNNFEEYVS